MSLSKPNLSAVIKMQYPFKMKTNAGMLIPLIIVQLVGFLFSLGGVGSSASSNIMIKHISGDIIIIFSLMYLFITGITLGRSGFKTDLTFVSNRISSHLSNMLFLVTFSFFAGITATLCGLLLRVVMYFTYSNVIAAALEPISLLSSILVAFLYAVMLSTLGYFAGILTRRNRIFNVLLTAVFFGSLMIQPGGTEQAPLLIKAATFFSREGSPLLFLIRVLLVSALAFGSVILFSNRMEVKE